MSLRLQVALDPNDTQWTFVIKSWPNGGENKRVYVMEKTGRHIEQPLLPVAMQTCLPASEVP